RWKIDPGRNIAPASPSPKTNSLHVFAISSGRTAGRSNPNRSRSTARINVDTNANGSPIYGRHTVSGTPCLLENPPLKCYQCYNPTMTRVPAEIQDDTHYWTVAPRKMPQTRINRG